MNRVVDYFKAVVLVLLVGVYITTMYWVWETYNVIWPVLVSAPLVMIAVVLITFQSTASIKCSKCGKEMGTSLLLSGLYSIPCRGKTCQRCGHENV